MLKKVEIENGYIMYYTNANKKRLNVAKVIFYF